MSQYCYQAIGHDKDCVCDHCRHALGEAVTCDHQLIERLIELVQAYEGSQVEHLQ